MENIKTLYEQKIQNRSVLRFIIGLYPRLVSYIYYGYVRYVAMRKGAVIGKNSVLPLALAKQANKNLIVGDHTSIQSIKIDLRSPVTIGNNVIIGSNVEIITTSHQIDSPEWEHKCYGITIEDYVWIATNVLVLPSCRKIGYGAICAAGSVISKEVESMTVVAGNPANILKKRRQVHSKLNVESLLGNDLISYIATYRQRGK